jgi:hypothetical protein
MLLSVGGATWFPDIDAVNFTACALVDKIVVPKRVTRLMTRSTSLTYAILFKIIILQALLLQHPPKSIMINVCILVI